MTLEGRLTVGMLKEMLKDVPDDCDVVVVDKDWLDLYNESSIQLVTQVGYLKSDRELHDAIGFSTYTNMDMREQIDLVDHMIFYLPEQPEEMEEEEIRTITRPYTYTQRFDKGTTAD